MVKMEVGKKEIFLFDSGKIRNDHIKSFFSRTPLDPAVARAEIYKKASFPVPETEAVPVSHIIHTYFHFQSFLFHVDSVLYFNIEGG